MRKVKKVLLTVGIAAVICVGGYFVLKPMVVDFVFDKFILGNTLSMLESTETAVSNEASQEAASGTALQEEEKQVPVETEESVAEETEERIAPAKKKVDDMTTGEVAAVVSRTPELINKLASIVSQSDKQRVIDILISNFTKAEIAEYSAKVSGGMTSQLKNELMAIARSRLTSAQWSECLNIFSKYVNDLKPYME